MTIEELWRALEVEGEGSPRSEWRTRHASPALGYPLLVAIDPMTGVRTLLLPVKSAVLPPRRDWPECRGLEVDSIAIDGMTHLVVRLVDPSSADVFAILAEDVCRRTAAAPDAEHAVGALLDRLRRWQQFLTATRTGLSLERERGLWGELQVLLTHLVPTLGGQTAVLAWKAYATSHQDFQLPSGAIEVKTTAAKQPQSIRITSERQLDRTGVGALFLHVVVVDEREVGEDPRTPGTSLPTLVGVVRSHLAERADTKTLFDDRLLALGYLDSHAARYDGRRRTVRREHTFAVMDAFPCLTEASLPTGVGDVSYALDLSACAPYVNTLEQMLNSLK